MGGGNLGGRFPGGSLPGLGGTEPGTSEDICGIEVHDSDAKGAMPRLDCCFITMRIIKIKYKKRMRI